MGYANMETSNVSSQSAKSQNLQKELPSLSLVLSLKNYNKDTGRWHGKIQLHGRPAEVDIRMFSSGFPVWGEILVNEGPASERWGFEERPEGVKYNLIKAHLPTMLMPHATAPGGGFAGVGIYLALKKILKDPKKSIPVGDISLRRSRVQGPGGTHFVKAVIDELSELTRAVKTAFVQPGTV